MAENPQIISKINISIRKSQTGSGFSQILFIISRVKVLFFESKEREIRNYNIKILIYGTL